MSDTSQYCPVTGGLNHFVLSFRDGSSPDGCPNRFLTGYGATYRDYLTFVTGSVSGRYEDGKIATALNFYGTVVYANGAGGAPLDPQGQDAERVANSLTCYPEPELGWACCLNGSECRLLPERICTLQGGTFMGELVLCEAGIREATATESVTGGALKGELAR